MTATRTPQVAKGRVHANGQRPSPGRSVNLSRVALAMMLIAGLSLAFLLLYTSAGDRHDVLAVARPVAAGSVITAADLTEARVSVDPSLRPIPVSRQSEVVGRAAAVDLVPGTLLTRGHLADGPVVRTGRDVVGLALKAGQLPQGVRAGDRVLLVRSGGTTTAGAATQPLSRRSCRCAVRSSLWTPRPDRADRPWCPSLSMRRTRRVSPWRLPVAK